LSASSHTDSSVGEQANGFPSSALRTGSSKRILSLCSSSATWPAALGCPCDVNPIESISSRLTKNLLNPLDDSRPSLNSSRDRLHQLQYVSKLEDVLMFLARERRLTDEHLSIIWQAQVRLTFQMHLGFKIL
jgi:hypothetical protein